MQLNAVQEELRQNPYNDMLTFNSVSEGQFYKDKGQAVVNRYQKPISLYVRLLKMFAFPGALVLDATCGTGSLELAAMEPDAPSGLQFIAFEKNKYQAEYCTSRLERSCTKPTNKGDILIDATGEKLSAEAKNSA